LARPTYTARLDKKICISESAQCYHFEFVIDELESFSFQAGQFISVVDNDAAGKQQTRAYSLASAANGNRFDLCVNRVQSGFFSNHLADLPVGGIVQVHGPHGHFVFQTPVVDSLLIATGTGIAPMRGIAQWLFPQTGPEAGMDRSEGRDIWLVYGTRYPSELYYREFFEQIAALKPNFHYINTVSRAGEEWDGNRGYVQQFVSHIVEQRAARLEISPASGPPENAPPTADINDNVKAYICGLNNMVSAVRQTLTSFGWHRQQIIFERYD